MSMQPQDFNDLNINLGPRAKLTRMQQRMFSVSPAQPRAYSRRLLNLCSRSCCYGHEFPVEAGSQLFYLPPHRAI